MVGGNKQTNNFRLFEKLRKSLIAALTGSLFHCLEANTVHVLHKA